MCEIYRIPYSAFLEWDPDDRHKAVMHQLHKAKICKSCGTHPDEWNPKAGGNRGAYVAEPKTCWGCNALAEGETELDKAKKDPHVRVPEGTRVQLVRPAPREDRGGRDRVDEGPRPGPVQASRAQAARGRSR